MKIRLPFVVLLLSFVAFAGCHKVFERPSWNTDMKGPLVKTSMTISNIVRDTSVVRVDADSLIRIISRTELFSNTINIDSFAQLEVTPYTKNVKLSTLVLEPQEMSYRMSLGQIALQMKKNGDATGDMIINNNGNTIFLLNDISNITAGPIDIDIQQFFEEAEIRTGTMEIKLDNGLPVNISNLQFNIKNKIGGEEITNQTFTNLNRNTSQTKTQDLAGKRVEGILALNVLDMDIPAMGFTPIKIDTSDAIIITMKVYDVTVNSATAVFPAQDVVNESSQIALEGLDNDVMLTKAKVAEGLVEAYATSTSADTVFFTYTINSATLNGQPFVMHAAVPPKAQNHHFTASFDNYDLNLRGKNNDTVNAFYNTIVGSIHASDKKVHMSLTDSFDVVVKINKFTASYIEGYFGFKTIDLGSGTSTIDIFKNIQSGTLNFDQVNANVVVENSLGLQGGFLLKSLTAVNTKAAKTASIPSTFGGSIAPATNHPLTPVTSSSTFNASDATNMLNILPDKFVYNLDMYYNNSISPPNYNDPDSKFPNFAYRDHYIHPYLEIDVPLSILAKDLVLIDTIDFLSDDFKSSVNSGTFGVQVENGFPIGGDLTVYFADQYGMKIDSITSASGILPGQLNPATHRVSAKTPSRITFYADNARMANIMKARKLIFKVKFSTADAASNVPVKIYSDYAIDFKLVGDFNYTVH